MRHHAQQIPLVHQQCSQYSCCLFPWRLPICLWAPPHSMHVMSLRRGGFGLQGDGVKTPQTLKASIERGALHVFGRQLPLPIRRA